jgi:hypothetical protein
MELVANGIGWAKYRRREAAAKVHLRARQPHVMYPEQRAYTCSALTTKSTIEHHGAQRRLTSVEGNVCDPRGIELRPPSASNPAAVRTTTELRAAGRWAPTPRSPRASRRSSDSRLKPS